MKIVVLPGLSSKNKPWLNCVGDKLRQKGDLYLHHWRTWSTENSFDYDFEIQRLNKIVSKNMEINFIAKSIGTRVLMKLLKQKSIKVNKIILCGIPIDPFAYYPILRRFNANQILVIQNSQDPYMPYKYVKPYLWMVNAKIKVLCKDSNTHDYPYYEEFDNWFL